MAKQKQEQKHTLSLSLSLSEKAKQHQCHCLHLLQDTAGQKSWHSRCRWKSAWEKVEIAGNYNSQGNR